MNGVVFDIEHGSFVDGPGIRTTIFLKGCNLSCAWCHNPESQSSKPQMMFYKDKCIGCGKCKELCRYSLKKCDFCGNCVLHCPQNARKIVGKEYTSDEIFDEIIKDKEFFDNSCGGATFSGGECMLQTDFLCEILKKCKENGVHTAVDTAGYVSFESFEKILPYTDLFLYDVKSMNDDIHIKYIGVSNKLILENLSKLLTLKKDIIIRIPIISDVNDNEEEILSVCSFIKKYGTVQKIELLPYHKMGESKYKVLGRECNHFSTPDNDKITYLKNIIKQTF